MTRFVFASTVLCALAAGSEASCSSGINTGEMCPQEGAFVASSMLQKTAFVEHSQLLGGSMPMVSGQPCSNVAPAWMTKKGKTCEDAQKARFEWAKFCKNNDWWSQQKYCQQSCGEAGYGYEGEDCRTTSTTTTTTIATTLGPKILIFGDSMAEYSGTALATFCKGARVYNAGIGGSTADTAGYVQWSTKVVANVVQPAKCDVTSPDFIWLSVGGNDNFYSACGLTAVELAAKITSAINQAKRQAPGVKILMVGYPMALKSYYTGCKTPQNFAVLKEATKSAADADPMVTFFDSSEVAGGNMTTWSLPAYFQDGVHMNNKGLCKVFTRTAIQTFLGCAVQTIDCDSVSCDIPGLDLQCNGSPRIRCPCCGASCLGASEAKTCNDAYKAADRLR